MQSGTNQRTQEFEARLVIDADDDLGIEVSFFDKEGMPEVQIVKLKNIARENFRYIRFLEAVYRRDKVLSEVLSEPPKDDNEKDEPPIDYKKAYKKLIERIFEYYYLKRNTATKWFFEDILSGENPYKHSYILTEHAEMYYDLLDGLEGIPQYVKNNRPPNWEYLGKCMRLLIEEKKKVNTHNLEKLYREKFPDEPPFELPLVSEAEYEKIKRECLG